VGGERDSVEGNSGGENHVGNGGSCGGAIIGENNGCNGRSSGSSGSSGSSSGTRASKGSGGVVSRPQSDVTADCSGAVKRGGGTLCAFQTPISCAWRGDDEEESGWSFENIMEMKMTQ
jgi:hypothetical protein